MPERSFGRTVRYRRTKLGLSQAKLGDLVGRSAATVRSWEADKSTPNDAKVVSTLSAILGVDEKTMFNKAGLELSVVKETSPTIEQALASLAPDTSEEETVVLVDVPELEAEEPPEPDPDPVPDQSEQGDLRRPWVVNTPQPDPLVPVGLFTLPDAPFRTSTQQVTTLSPQPVAEPSYIEEASQKQLYLVRTLATVVGLVALVVALLWAAGESLAALGDWWEDFVGSLRL